MKYIATIALALLLGCATTGSDNSLSGAARSGQLPNGLGLIVMSAGRVASPGKDAGANFAGNLPFVSYHILKKLSDGKYQEVAFVPAEYISFNKLDAEDYGFIHVREVEAGHYLLKGENQVGHGGMASNGAVSIYFPDDIRGDSHIVFEVDIVAGVINYLGEFVTTNGNLRTENIRVKNRQERDIEYVLNKYPKLKNYPVQMANVMRSR